MAASDVMGSSARYPSPALDAVAGATPFSSGWGTTISDRPFRRRYSFAVAATLATATAPRSSALRLKYTAGGVTSEGGMSSAMGRPRRSRLIVHAVRLPRRLSPFVPSSRSRQQPRHGQAERQHRPGRHDLVGGVGFVVQRQDVPVALHAGAEIRPRGLTGGRRPL